MAAANEGDDLELMDVEVELSDFREGALGSTDD